MLTYGYGWLADAFMAWNLGENWTLWKNRWSSRDWKVVAAIRTLARPNQVDPPSTHKDRGTQ